MTAQPIGDVWILETPDEEVAAETLSLIANWAIDGNRKAQNYLKKLWDGESWPSIKEKLQVEGSAWCVWWMDGVRAFMREMV